MRAGAEPLGAAVLIRVHAFVAPVLRAAELGRDEIVWLVTLVALAVPLIALPLLDRLLRKPWVYIGHAGLALYAKSRRQRLSLALLVAVAYAPDWIEWAVGVKHGFTSRGALLSHSIPAVAVGASLVAVGALLARWTRADAGALFLLYASHWAVDFVTGVKPTWPGAPAVGLSLYTHPVADFALEGALALACALAYLRALPARPRRGPVWIMLALLVVLQAAFDAGLARLG